MLALDLLQECQQKCVICGERAIGKNFNAYTCQPCKAFFRRNATASKDLKCYRKDNCEIDLKTRKYCKKCRLVKCYAMGMKTDVIVKNDMKKELKLQREIGDRNGGHVSIKPDPDAVKWRSDSVESYSTGSDTNTGSPDIPYHDFASHPL
ncbi:unnamed protein product, partial [Oppiella nova]